MPGMLQVALSAVRVKTDLAVERFGNRYILCRIVKRIFGKLIVDDFVSSGDSPLNFVVIIPFVLPFVGKRDDGNLELVARMPEAGAGAFGKDTFRFRRAYRSFRCQTIHVRKNG